MVAIIDYGVGNLLAIQNIIKKAGGNSVITSDFKTIESADKIILPGVGSFAYGMDQLNRRGLTGLLKEQVFGERKIILGLCLGAQMMTAESEEGVCQGLGWVDAVTRKFDPRYVSITPHMNWADVKFVRPTSLSAELGDTSRFYFVHSYHFHFAAEEQVIATACYGYEFACAFRRDNIYGVQFHPEKSHRFGMQLFVNFLAL